MATKFPTQAGLAGHTFANIDGAGETHRNWMAAVGGRLTRVIDVKVDFGAVGNGSTDDSAAIQAALNTFGSQGFFGPTIYFPQGVYYCATGLTCTNVGLKMVGEGSTGIDAIIGNGPVQILVGNAQWGLTLGSASSDQFSGYYVEGIYFAEKNAGQGLGAVRLLRVSNATIENVCAGSFTAGTGFLVDGTGDVCQYNTFTDCRVGECLTGYSEKLTNGTRWNGGIIQASNGSTPVTGSIGIKLDNAGDSFRSTGTVIQGFDTNIEVGGGFGHSFEGVRLEIWKTQGVHIKTGSKQVLVEGCADNSLVGALGSAVVIDSGATDTVDGVRVFPDTTSAATAEHVDNGTRTRFINEWGSDVNVRTFGARGNGSTDDTAAIQAALTYMKANGGGTVTVPAGTYVTSATIYVPDRCSLRGAGKRATILTAKSTFPGVSALSGTIASASNAVNTSTFVGAQTLTVSATTGAPSSGMLQVATGTLPAIISYTGTTGTTYTGCTTLSGGGVMATGGATRIAAPMINLGRLTDTPFAYDVFCQDLQIDAASHATIGVHINHGQEGCGLRSVVISEALTLGLFIDGPGNNAHLYEDIEVLTDSTSAYYAVEVVGAGIITINRMTAFGGGIGTCTASIHMANVGMRGEDWHCEGATDGMRIGSEVYGSVHGVDASAGANTTTYVVHYTSSTRLHVTGIAKQAATHTMLVDNSSITVDTVSIPDASAVTVSGTNDQALSTTPTAPASGANYTNATGWRQWIIVNGGTGTIITVNRNASVSICNQGAAAFNRVQVLLAPGDTMQITYSVAPTLTVFPM